MCPNRSLRREAGLGLISAIFVIVILAIVVVGMSNIATVSQKYRSQEILAARALFAAESGAQLHLSTLLHPENSQTCATMAAPANFNTHGLRECSYQASCAQVTINTIDYFTVKSVGRCGTGVDSATRAVEMRISR